MNRIRHTVFASAPRWAACALTLATIHAAAAGQSPTAPSATARTATTIAVAIPAMPIGAALNELGRQTGMHIVMDAQITQGLTSKSLEGTFTVDDALTRLLADSGLRYEYLDARTIAIRSKAVAAARSDDVADPPLQIAQNAAASQAGAQHPEQESSENNKAQGPQEIIVTAQKRSERLQDVPVPVTAIAGEDLTNSNLQRVQDYYSRLPGLNLTTGAWGEPRIAIRGIVTDPFDNPTVGIVVDDLPYGSSANLAGNGGVPDIDPGDLARVEVLRGPQGTLYGAGGMGGLLKFVTIDPSTERVSGRVQVGANSVQNGDEVGYALRGSVNLPLGDTWALRASGFTRRDPGYITNVRTGEEGVNWGEAKGGRLVTLWRPSDAFSLKLSAMVQDTRVNGAADADLGLRDLEQNNTVGTGEYARDTQSYNATISARLGTFNVLSVSGYSVDTFTAESDLGHPAGFPADWNFALPQDVRTEKFTQEIRFDTALGARVDWLFGVFYTDEKNISEQDVLIVNAPTGELIAPLLVGHFPNTLREYAAFTDFTFKISDRFDVQVGGRESRFKQTYRQSIAFPPGPADVTPRFETDASAFTYLLTPRFRVSDDLMTYARFASGYRAGGPNSNTTILVGIPDAFEPDTTRTYELGIKGTAVDRKLTFDASLYYIDWRDIQLKFQRGQFSFRGNGSRAKSQGVELNLEARPVRGLRLATWLAWNDAKLTEDLPPESVQARVYGASGDRLPFSSPFSANFSVDQEFPLGSSVMGFVGGTLSYVDERNGIFVDVPPSIRAVYPSYTRADLRAGARFESWMVNLFINNVTDKRGILQSDAAIPTSLLYIQPRLFGMSIGKAF